MSPARLHVVSVASRVALTLILATATLGIAAGPAAAGVCSVKNLASGALGPDLQQAIDAASSGDALRISGTCDGPFTVARDLRMLGTLGASLDGNAAGSTLTITAGQVRVIGLRITNGTGTDLCAPSGCSSGGGISNHGSLTLIGSKVVGNRAGQVGGGIFNDLGSSLTIVGSSVSANDAVSAGGGIDNLGTASVSRSTVRGNSASGGGGILNNGTLTLDRSTIFENAATELFGGGLINNGTTTIVRSRFIGNSADAAGGYGGAITNQFGGVVRIVASTLSGNTSAALGGAISDQTGGFVSLDRSRVTSSASPFGGGIFEGGGTLGITASRIDGNSAGNGGGIYASATATVTVTRSAIGGNVASNGGGGVFEAGGSLTVGGSSLRGNSASSGGGIYATPGSTLAIARSRITDNTVSPGIGGGIFNGGTITLTRSSLSRNAAGAGGGMFSSGGSATVEDSAIAGNTASSGGGLLNTGGTMRVARSTVADNAVAFNGGGIFNSDGALTVLSSTLNGNSASDPNGGGGGIYNGIDVAAASTLELTNSTMTANVADAFGGAIINVGTAVISRSTLSGNSAASGGGIFNGNSGPIVGSATLAATIDAGNGGGNCSGVGTTSSNGFNVVGPDCAFASIGDRTVADTASAIGIAPLADNGGPTRTMALLPPSPAVDAIPLGILSQDGTLELCSLLGSTDQRGVARPQGPACDVGAFELVPSGDVAILDTLGAATPATTFEIFGSGGQTASPFQYVGPQFTLAQPMVITEIGAFINHNCIPNCPAALPFLVQIRPTTGGTPDPSTVLATFVLSDDGDSLVLSYESVSTNVTLAPGSYSVLFLPQDAVDGALIGFASTPFNYQAGLVNLGFLDPIGGTGLAGDSFAAVRILGHPA
jgi:hypothetical protein